MTPYYADELLTLHLGDAIEIMRELPEASVDAIVTDPPYGLEFMGKEWDAFKANGKSRLLHSPKDEGRTFTNESGHMWDNTKALPRMSAGTPFQQWCTSWATEAWRVTRPGGYLLAFGGCRTHHRLVCGLEDAGWIIRDELTWIYASGFPKGKANLKPAHEPIVLARKPGPLQPLGIDAGRIGVEERPVMVRTATVVSANSMAGESTGATASADLTTLGRWPSNVLLSDPELFDQPNDEVVGSGAVTASGDAHVLRRGSTTGAGMGYGSSAAGDVLDATYGDTGGYSRFFLIPKADRTDREPVLRGQLAHSELQTMGDGANGHDPARPILRENGHPTVKPIDLMRHLVRLVTPSGGVVCDPFLGSGSTALAANAEGFRCIGIEKEREYLDIAMARLLHHEIGLAL